MNEINGFVPLFKKFSFHHPSHDSWQIIIYTCRAVFTKDGLDGRFVLKVLLTDVIMKSFWRDTL